MTEAAAITAVMRALADPTRRAVFERVVSSDEITVVGLTRGSGVTQGAISQHLKSLSWPAWSPSAPKAATSIIAQSPRASGRSSTG